MPKPSDLRTEQSKILRGPMFMTRLTVQIQSIHPSHSFHPVSVVGGVNECNSQSWQIAPDRGPTGQKLIRSDKSHLFSRPKRPTMVGKCFHRHNSSGCIDTRV